MKFVVVPLVLLPIALGAAVDNKRFFDILPTGSPGFGIVPDIVQQIISQIGTTETEAQCEAVMCPQALKTLGISSRIHNQLIENLLCTSVCKEVQVIQHHQPDAAVVGK